MSIAFTKTIRGVAVPTLGIGTWEVEGPTATETVADAIAAGYRHVDTAVAYGNHAEVGEGIRRSGIARDELWLTTKIWLDSYAPKRLRESAEQALKDLGVDYLDLLLLHWPAGDDAETEPALRALQQLRDDSLIRELGVSNFPDYLLRPALQIAPEIFADQVEYHAHLAHEKLTATALELDLMITAYSPLAHGEGLTAESVVTEVAAKHGVSPAQVCIAWLARQGNVTVLPRSTNPDRRRENLAALEVDLTAGDVAELDELSRPGKRYINPPFAPRWDD
ncbi:MAG: aldo/keto reductase [Streptosporangiales bacterium]|nr:aldo/keto reductase [Streptosporangiales bacterium]